MMTTHLSIGTISGETQHSLQEKPRRNKRIYPRRLTRRAKLPWFRCKKCGRRIAQMDIHDGHTAIVAGRGYTSGPLHCPNCGAVREFRSMPAE